MSAFGVVARIMHPEFDLRWGHLPKVQPVAPHGRASKARHGSAKHGEENSYDVTESKSLRLTSGERILRVVQVARRSESLRNRNDENRVGVLFENSIVCRVFYAIVSILDGWALVVWLFGLFVLFIGLPAPASSSVAGWVEPGDVFLRLIVWLPA